MAAIIRLTEHWVSVTGNAEQELDRAIDVLPYDVLDLQAHVAGDLPITNCTVSINLLTAMSRTAAGINWQQIGSVSVNVSTGTRMPTSTLFFSTITNSFFRYLRWQVTNYSNFSSVRFLIQGIGRSYR